MGNLSDPARRAQEEKPYIVGWIHEIVNAKLANLAAGRPASAGGAGGGGGGGSGGGGGVAAHVLATTTGLSSKHTVAGLTAGQVLQATGATTALFGVLSHTALGGVTADQHHAQAHALDGSDHTGTLSWAKVSKTGASLADLPTRLYSDLQSRQHSITGSDHSIAGAQYSVVGATATNTLGLLTPVADASGSVSALLRSSAGALTLDVLTAATRVRAPLIDTASGDLTLSPVGNVKLTSGTRIASDNYASQTTGWGITYAGAGDFRYLYTDEMHAKSFIADLEQALAGGQIISKSVAVLAVDFTAPAAGSTATLRVKDLPSAPNMAVFVSGDIVRLRAFSRSGGSLTIANCWGAVTSYADQSDGTQTWTFTRSSGGNAGSISAGTVIAADALVLDYGTTGNGFYEVNAIDGVYAANSPYWQVVTWTSHPATGQVVNVRGGKLDGLGLSGGYSDEMGLYAGDGVTDADAYIRVGNKTNRLNNLPMEWWSGGTKIIGINNTNGITISTAASFGSLRAYTFASGATIYSGLYGVYNSGAGTLDVALMAGRWSGAGLAGSLATNRLYLRAAGTAAQTAETYLEAYSGVPGDVTSYYARLKLSHNGTTPTALFEGYGGSLTVTISGSIDAGSATFDAVTADVGGFTAAGTSVLPVINAAAGVQVQYNGATKLQTTSSGATVTGTLTVGASLVLDWNGPYYGYVVKADVGGAWARGLNFLNSSAALLGAFGAYGGSDALTYLYIGAAYNDYTVRVDPVNHRVGIGDNITPTSALSVGGAADFAGNVTVSHASSPAVIVTDTTNSVSGRIAANDTVFQVGSISNHNLEFFANSVTKATLSTGGDFTLSASGATLGAPNVNATTAFQRDGVAGSIFVPMTPTNLTDTGSTVWSGVSRAAGTYTFDVNTAANGSVPTEAVAVAVMGTFTWTNSNNSTYATIQKPSGAYSIVARATASAIGIDVAGVVQIDSSGQFTVTINNATSNTSLLRIVGYYI